MGIQVIPAINADSFEEVKRRIKLVEPYVESVQLDICDGTFTKNTTWHNASDLLALETPLQIEVHLMINNIEERVEEWLIAPVQRIIFHLETAKDPEFVIEKCRQAGKEVGIAIGPDTSWTQLIPFCGKVDPVRSSVCPTGQTGRNRRFLASNGVALFQILAVYPGLAGQKFQKDNLDKIRRLKENCSSVKIEVDGGIDKHNVQKVAEAGADIVSAATAIFSASDIGKAIEELKGTTESAEEFLPPETKRKKLCPHLLLPKKISIAALIFVILAALVIINLYLQFLNLKF